MDITNFYAEMKSDLVSWAETQPGIRLVVQVGSHTRKVKPGDQYSDLDIGFFLEDEGMDAQVEAILAWMQAYRRVWVVLEEKHGDSPAWLYLYQGGFKVDIDVTPVSALSTLIETQELWEDQRRGYEILLDKDGFAPQMPPPQYDWIPPFLPPTEARFRQRVENFFFGADYIARQIKRRNLWKVKWASVYQQNFLLEMLEWHARVNHGRPIDTYFRGDFMQDWVDEHTWEEIHGVFGRFDTADSRRALLASIGLFTRLAGETADQLGYAYPAEMIGEVVAYLEDLTG